MEISKPRLWTKNFIMISSASLFIGLVFFLTITTVSLYVIEKFHASQSMAGLSASIFVIGVLIARFFTGKNLERIGRKKLARIGVVFTFLATLFYFPIEHLSIFIAIRFFHGIMTGVVLTVLQTTVVDMIPKKRKGEGISYYSLSFILATAVGPFLGGLIIQYFGISMVFIVCSFFSIISLFLILLISFPTLEAQTEQLNDLKGFHYKNLFEMSALPISLLMGILSFCYSSILAFLTSYAIEMDLIVASSFFFIIYSAFIFISRPFTGRILDLKGETVVMYPSLLLFSTGLFVLSQSTNGMTLLIAGAILGLGYGNLHSTCQTISVKNAPPYRIGLATSTFFICAEIGMGIGPFLLGFIVPIIGFERMYMVLGIISLTCVFVYYLITIKGNNKVFQERSQM